MEKGKEEGTAEGGDAQAERKPAGACEGDYIKANVIADKCVSTMYGYPKMVRKAEMDEAMLRDREAVLADAVELMALDERLGLGLSVSGAVYRKHCDAPVGKTA
jgi:hypothetical protein